MKRAKRIIALLCACFSLFVTNISVYAAEPVSSSSESSIVEEYYDGVSPTSPEAETRSTSRPSKVWIYLKMDSTILRAHHIIKPYTLL